MIQDSNANDSVCETQYFKILLRLQRLEILVTGLSLLTVTSQVVTWFT